MAAKCTSCHSSAIWRKSKPTRCSARHTPAVALISRVHSEVRVNSRCLFWPTFASPALDFLPVSCQSYYLLPTTWNPRLSRGFRKLGILRGLGHSLRVRVFYHDKCFDGASSAALFSRFYRERISGDAT